MVVRITSAILHMLDGPVSDFQGQRQVFRIADVEEFELIDRPRAVLNVERQAV